MTSPFFKRVEGALGVDETSRVLSLYGGVADADLAWVAPIDQGGDGERLTAKSTLYECEFVI
jgi:hypothetical protein